MSEQTEKQKRAAEREARLAEALRANLRRRKAQKKARKAGDDPAPQGPAGGVEGGPAKGDG